MLSSIGLATFNSSTARLDLYVVKQLPLDRRQPISLDHRVQRERLVKFGRHPLRA